MPQSYSMAEVVEEVAQDLITQYHPDLVTARIKFLFQEFAGKKNGKVIAGVAKKVSGVMEFFAECDFILLVALDQWNEMDKPKRLALVDHLLERCKGEEDDQTGETKWSMREPDVHEFSTILKRHGTWADALADFVDVAKSLDQEDYVEESDTADVTVGAE